MAPKKILIILTTITLLLVVILVIGKKQGWIGNSAEHEVTVEEAKRRTIVETVTASGKIFPQVEVKISSDVSGEIIALYIEEGDSVNEGDLLVKIKPDIYQSAVERAEASLNQSRANLANARARFAQVKAQTRNAWLNYKRNKQLYANKVISDADFEQIETTYYTAKADSEAAYQSVLAAEFTVKSAEASLKEAKENLLKTQIFAPMSGIISLLNVEKGERVVGTLQMAGTEILRIANLNNMEVRVDVSENDVLRVKTGDTAYVEVDAFYDRKFLGVVTQVANSASSVTQQLTSEQATNFTVKIRLLPSSYRSLIEETGHRYPFRPGMSASVDIITNRVHNAVSVPIQAVVVREDLFSDDETRNALDTEIPEVVFVFDNGVARLRKVTTGIQDDRYIEIKEGIDEGEPVITGPYNLLTRTLKDGDAVQKKAETKKKRDKPSRQE